MSKRIEEDFDQNDWPDLEAPQSAIFTPAEWPQPQPRNDSFPSSNYFPWKISGRVHSGNAQISVSAASIIYKSPSIADKSTITHLATWLTVGDGDKIYVEVDSSTLDSDVKVGTWTDAPSLIGWVDAGAVNKVQNYAYLLVGTVKATLAADDVAAVTIPTTTPLYVVQHARAHQILDQSCQDGATILLPRTL
jgi:hypothetical protein